MALTLGDKGLLFIVGLGNGGGGGNDDAAAAGWGVVEDEEEAVAAAAAVAFGVSSAAAFVVAEAEGVVGGAGSDFALSDPDPDFGDVASAAGLGAGEASFSGEEEEGTSALSVPSSLVLCSTLIFLLLGGDDSGSAAGTGASVDMLEKIKF